MDVEGFISGGTGCTCGRLYTYAGQVEPRQFNPACPVHNCEGEPDEHTRFGCADD